MNVTHASADAAIPVQSLPSRLLKATGGMGSFLALVAACLVFAAIDPNTFVSLSNLRTLLDQAAVPMIVVCGLTFVVLIGGIDLSIEGVLASASLVYVLVSPNSRNILDLGVMAPVAALLVGAGFGLASGLLHNKLRIPSFMVSLGLWFIGLGVASVLYGSDVPMLTDQTRRGWASGMTLGVSNAVCIAAACVLVAWFLAKRSKFGRFAYAIGTSEPISRLNSVPVAYYKILVYVFCGLCVGLAALIATDRLGVGTPDVGNGQLFFSTAAVIIGGTPLSGGRGGVLQSVCGVLLLVVINNGLIVSGAGPIAQQALAGLIIVVAVVATGLRHRSQLRVVK